MPRKKEGAQQVVEKQSEVKKEEKKKGKEKKMKEKAKEGEVEKEKKEKVKQEEKKVEKKEEKKVEKKKGEERIITINLKEAWKAKRDWRAVAAVNVLREQLRRHTKRETVKIDKTLNNVIWKRGIEKPPRRIKIRVVIFDKEAIAYPA